MTLHELYNNSVKPLPAAQRLRLAALILNDIPAEAVVDYSEEWTADDLSDVTRASLQRLDAEEDPSHG
jgi:hypothetical protein